MAMMTVFEVIEKSKPDLILLLGDRYEALAVPISAMIAGVPIAHIYGGEVTAGAIDEAIRHSISKMLYIHFISTEEYRQRVIQLGEQPARVFNFGAPGLENITKTRLIPEYELRNEYNIPKHKKYFLITVHPETLKIDGGLKTVNNLISALTFIDGYHFVFTYPNADTNCQNIITAIEQFKKSNPKNVVFEKYYGQLKYLSLMSCSSAVIGNSSSGIIEATTLGVPSIDIGDRQRERVMAKSVILCNSKITEIVDAVKVATDHEFLKSIQNVENPYGCGNSSKMIVKTLEEINLSHLLSKDFFDITLVNNSIMVR